MRSSVVLAAILANSAFAQEEDLSLSDMFKVEIVTASKKAESRFDAPLSSSVITREEIERSGVTNIQEALRLSPSIVSRQLTNGAFEYSIRGSISPARGGSFQDKQVGSALVMIDNRIVFNYYAGGVLWNTLPIGLHDVEQIEIVKGPASALYGPNAVSGVINIISKKPKFKKSEGMASVNYGSYRTGYGGAIYSFGGETNAFSISVNGDRRERFSQEWLSYNSSPLPEKHSRVNSVEEYIGRYGTSPGVYRSGYPMPERANNAGSVNLMWSKDLGEGNLLFTSSYQNNRSQTIYADPFFTNYINQESDSGNANLKVDYAGVNAQIDYTKGFANLIMGTANSTYLQKYIIKDAVIEKNIELGSFEIKPGVNYKIATYDSYFIGGEQSLKLQAGMLRTEYKGENTRVIVALRSDKVNKPDKATLGYQASVFQKLTPRDNLRLIVGRASASPFIYDTYLRDKGGAASATATVVRNAYGRSDGKLLDVTNAELGSRHNVFSNYALDFELFRYQAQNFAQSGGSTTVTPDPADPKKVIIETSNTIEGLDGYNPVTQGGTVALDYVSSDKSLSGKFFVSAQQTKIGDAYYFYDVPAYQRIEKGAPVYTPGVYYSEKKAQPKYDPQTPRTYGGLYLNLASGKVNYNLTAYGMSKSIIANRIAEYEIPRHYSLNAQVSYKVTDRFNASINGRNINNSRSREYGVSERIPSQVILGLDSEI